MSMEMTYKVMGVDASVMDGLLFLVGMNLLSIGFHLFARCEPVIGNKQSRVIGYTF